MDRVANEPPVADAQAMTVAALSFDPIFLYIALALAGVIAIARLLLSWAA